ncbi:fused MFS/spermidine synthase [uncultured Hyphomonas sp.]|uniref:fused MFS/spermidine synthase n=1 Tax=uncultured Hyphomonas sp. TaxID=225298 RepID=UPI002AAAA5F7|nr:fused MFS/spermidine synthase [uncultured Hyphomonas sp.]
MQAVEVTGTRLARRAGAAPFVATVFLSAGLVFLVQPMFAKMATPLLGGAPSVWNVSLVCFQAALLAGYAYAHLLARLPNVKVQVGLHALLLLLASFCLPLSINGLFGAPDTTRPALWLIGTFAISIAPPFAAISATAPLVQSWYARSGRPDAADPYHLYAASNAGSLIGLAAYPLLMEPFTRLGTQSGIWSLGYLTLAVLLVACGLLTAGHNAPAAGGHADAAISQPPVSSVDVWKERMTWLALSAVPSALLVGVTAHISTDVASAPFLWAPPLMAYIGTFIIVFSVRPLISHQTALIYTPYAIAMATLLIIGSGVVQLGLIARLATHILTLFLVALALHGELAARRPDASRLTEFYLLMSLGGVIGAAFASLLAPVIFNGVYEYPVLLCAALLLLPSPESWCNAWQRSRILLGVIAGVAILALALPAMGAALPRGAIFFGATLCIAAATFFHARRLVPAGATAAAFLLGGSGQADQVVASERGFFGLVRAIETDDGRVRIMAHGTTNHGSQRLNATGRPEPQTYYHAKAPIGQVFSEVAPDFGHVGVVGLGVGSVACYRQPSQTYTFFEIDPVVVHMAQDPSLFTFLTDCAPDERIVLGDARITLGNEPAGGFDLLLLDAFSSDAIPAHLLTREAMALYLSRLSDEGIILFHISNRHMNLAPVVARTGAAEGASMLQQIFVHNPDDPAEAGANSSFVVMLARTPKALDRFRADPRWAALETDGQRPWTDDYSNIVGTLYETHFGRHPLPRAAADRGRQGSH